MRNLCSVKARAELAAVFAGLGEQREGPAGKVCAPTAPLMKGDTVTRMSDQDTCCKVLQGAPTHGQQRQHVMLGQA